MNARPGTRRALLLLGALLAVTARGAGAQSLGLADSLYFAGDPRASLEVLGGEPPAYDVHWRQARAAAALGQLDDDRDRRVEWYRVGVEFGRQAEAAAPGGLEGRYWLAASLGLLGLTSTSPRTQAEAGEQAYQTALALLEVVPDHAGGHNVLGRIHYEVRKMAFAARFLGRIFIGGVIGKANWEDARTHLERAVDLDPKAIRYRLDLARFYLSRELPDLARAELEAALGLPRVDPADGKMQEQAAAILGGLEASAQRSPR